MSVVVDPEFKSLLPPLTKRQRDGLEALILANGRKVQLIAWNGTLIDGHHRKEICDRHGISFSVESMEFPDREQVKLWILSHARDQRNLTEDQNTVLAAKEQRIRSEIEKREQRAAAGRASAAKRNGNGEDKASPPLKPDAKERTRATIAKNHGIPERKLRTFNEVEKAKPALVEKIEAGEMTVKEAHREVRREKKETERAEAAKEAEKITVADDYGVRHGDFREVAKTLDDASVDLVFTDPPYDRKTLPLYADMAEAAARILKPGGSMICYLGQFQIGEVCDLVSPHLRLWWTLACVHTGKSARMTEYGIVVKWKPMLWFVRGTRGDKQTFVDDLIESRMEKDAHDWQQSVVEASYYIDKLTLPGGFVFDPFCGGATTAVAAKQLKRKYLTCDVDEVAVKLARRRLHDTQI